jgi:hypothetical protein
MSRVGSDLLGVVILESLTDSAVMQGITVLRASDIKAPPGDPYPVWSRRLVRVPAAEIESFAARLAANMKEDFYNHFVDDQDLLVVVFKGKHFLLDKHDKSTWTDMIRYGESVRVGAGWTMSIRVDQDRLL